ncbi:DUF4145 domain-containing protein [Metapseudomonas otitidis]|uniref:DUF4145 domain-containing protein n=1 Tax=Metapseudomonas otitidis TaxID=319939 RepID=UPI00405539A6
MSKIFSYTCPYCNHKCLIKENETLFTNSFKIFRDSANSYPLIILQAIICPNPDCKELTLKAYQYIGVIGSGDMRKSGEAINTWKLLPDSAAKPFPNYIPAAILQDYTEACRIIDLSPKASATLARRCLQGIIRDFWQEKKSSLHLEIEAIKDRVSADVWEAIDALRHIGNIGAHMEKDINLIIDVEPDEALLLVELIEFLLEEWYIARHDRQEKMAKIKAIAQQKQDERKAAAGNQPASAQPPT